MHIDTVVENTNLQITWYHLRGTVVVENSQEQHSIYQNQCMKIVFTISSVKNRFFLSWRCKANWTELVITAMIDVKICIDIGFI